MKKPTKESTEEPTTVYVTSDADQDIRRKMIKLMDKPLFVQRFVYFNENVLRNYTTRVIYDKPDRITILDKSFKMSIGNSGLYIKQHKILGGVTYKKQGRSSSRITFWGTATHKNNQWDQFDILKAVAIEVNKDSLDLLNIPTIRVIATNGMLGSILAGKITNLKEAMDYYVRYSMRGMGIDLENSLNLFNYIRYMDMNHHMGLKALRVAKDPNEVLSLITDNDQFKFVNQMKGSSESMINCALSLSEKIDWSSPRFDLSAESSRLHSKVTVVKNSLGLWTGGPVVRLRKYPEPLSVLDSFTSVDTPF